MKIRHLPKVDAATAVDNNNKPSEEKVSTDALFSLLKKTEAPQADSQTSVVLGNWTNNLQEGFNTSGLTTADNYTLISSDNFVIDIENQ